MESCGPTNALNKLSTHVQRDNSLQNEFRPQHQAGPGFKQNGGVDAGLNKDFASFTRNDFAQSFMGNNPMFQKQNNQIQYQNLQNQFNQNQQNHQNHQNLQLNQNQFNQHFGQNFVSQFQQQNDSKGVQDVWVQDFSNMSMKEAPQHHQIRQNYAYQPMMAYRPQTFQQTEHKEVHSVEQEQKMYDEQFEQLEKQLQDEAQETHTDLEKDEFARVAEKVKESMMSSDVAGEKLQNSNFLKLMNSISNRQVELEGDKLVETSQTERPIHTREVPITDIPVQRPVAEEMKPHLPDPLAHLKDGDLEGIESPLMAAKVVSGNQVQTSDWMDDDAWLDMTQQRSRPRRANIMSDEWQEVYDDYKNDDDSH